MRGQINAITRRELTAAIKQLYEASDRSVGHRSYQKAVKEALIVSKHPIEFAASGSRRCCQSSSGLWSVMGNFICKTM